MLSPAGAAQAEALARFSAGLIHQFRGDVEGSVSNFLAAIAADPLNDELYLRTAMAYVRLNQPDAAIAVLEQLARLKPRSERPLLWMALVYRGLDRLAEAEQAYQRAIRLAPREPAPYLELAGLYLRQNREDDAIRLLENAVDKVEKPQDIWRLLGQLYIRKSAASPAPSGEERHRKAAIEALERVAREVPDDITTLYQLGDLYILDQQIEKAISFFERIEKLDPDNLRVKERLALSFALRGDQKKAIETLEQLAREQPGKRQIFYYLGELYEKLGDKEKAALNYRLAARAGPPEPAPYLKWALLAMNEDPEEAVRILREGLAQMPGQAHLMEMLGCVFLAQKRYREAQEAFEETEQLLAAQNLRPLLTFFHLNYAVAAQHAGDIETAAATLARAMEISPDYLETYVQYIFQEDDPAFTESALQVLERLTAQWPENAYAHMYLGLLCSYAHRYEQAVAAFEKAEGAAARTRETGAPLSFDANFYFWYGAACERVGQLERADALLRQCLAADPQHADAYNYIAYMWAEKGLRLDEALSLVTRALELKPNSGAFVDTLGWIYFMQGRYEEALTELRRAAELMPDDPTILDHLGDAHAKLGHQEAALEAWKNSFLQDPSNESVAAKLRERGADLESLRAQAEEKKRQREAEKAERKKSARLLPAPAPEPEGETPSLPSEPAPPLPTPELVPEPRAPVPAD